MLNSLVTSARARDGIFVHQNFQTPTLEFYIITRVINGFYEIESLGHFTQTGT